MAKRSGPSVAQDFKRVIAFLTTKGIIPTEPPQALVSTARRIHRATYSLILWRFRIKGLPGRSRVFLEEVGSDALQILPQSLMGYGKTTRLLIRGIIENAFRHIYFADHQIEFDRMNREKKWYLEMDELFFYPSIHPSLLDLERKFDAVNRLRTLYDELSAAVHGRRVSNLEMRAALRKIAFEQGAFDMDAQLIERCAGPTNFLLAAFHSVAFNGFNAEERRTILTTLPAAARRTLTGLD